MKKMIFVILMVVVLITVTGTCVYESNKQKAEASATYISADTPVAGISVLLDEQ
jgi:uncharacterized protein YxeA